MSCVHVTQGRDIVTLQSTRSESLQIGIGQMDVARVQQLTKREREVLTLIAEGYSAEAIAARLHRSTKTIQTHRQSLGRKLGLSNRVELTRFAIAAGLVSVSVDDHNTAPEYLNELREQATTGKRAMEALRHIDLGAELVTGDELLNSIVQRLKSALSVDSAVVSKVERRCDTSQTILTCSCGVHEGSCHARLNGCATCLDVCDNFMRNPDPPSTMAPCDEATNLDDHRYGVPIMNLQGQCAGMLVVRSNSPIHDDEMVEHILRIAASRIAVEFERQQVEQAYREQVDTEQIPVGMFRSTPDGLIIAANATLLKMYGYESLEEMRKVHNPDHYADPNDRIALLDLLNTSKSVTDYRVKTLRKDGRIIHVSLSMHATCDDNGRMVFLDGVARPLDD